MWPKHVAKASPKEMHLYSDQALQDLIEASLKLAKEKIEDWKLSHHPDLHRQVVEQCMEEHRERVEAIEYFFFQKRTGRPF